MFNFSITHQTLEFKESTKDYFPLEESIPVNAYFTVRNDCLLNNPYIFFCILDPIMNCSPLIPYVSTN